MWAANITLAASKDYPQPELEDDTDDDNDHNAQQKATAPAKSCGKTSKALLNAQQHHSRLQKRSAEERMHKRGPKTKEVSPVVSCHLVGVLINV